MTSSTLLADPPSNETIDVFYIKNAKHLMLFVDTAAENSIFSHKTLCRFINYNWRFGGACCLHLRHSLLSGSFFGSPKCWRFQDPQIVVTTSHYVRQATVRTPHFGSPKCWRFQDPQIVVTTSHYVRQATVRTPHFLVIAVYREHHIKITGSNILCWHNTLFVRDLRSSSRVGV